jgi:hypothetical protein
VKRHPTGPGGYPLRRYRKTHHPRKLAADPRRFGLYPKPALVPPPAEAPESERRSA